MSSVVVGIDIGTTGVKAVVLDTGRARILATAGAEYPSQTSSDGGHEQDPEHWWAAVCRATTQVLAQADSARVAGVGLSGQMHSLLLVDDDGAPLAPAMTWADRRPRRQTARLAEHGEFRRRAGNTPVAAHTAPKLAWLAEHRPQVIRTARHLVLAKDYIGFKLTGSWATDTTDAMGTLLWDAHTRQWDAELFDVCGARVELAPPVLDSTRPRGTVTARAAAATGLPVGTMVGAGAGDVSAAAVGSGADRQEGCLSAGTAAQAMAGTSSAESWQGFLFGDARQGEFLAMASVYACGASIRWAREALGGPEPMDRLDQAEQIPAGAEGLVYLPFMYGASLPRKNDEVRAAFLGQTQSHSAAHMMAAVIEGVAFACADAVEAVADHVGGVRRLLLVGGVAGSARWRSALAGVLDIEISHGQSGGSPLGAAILGAVAAEVAGFEDLTQAAEPVPVPVPPPEQVRALRTSREVFGRGCELLV